MPNKQLIVLGAGPKGIALAAKAAVLRELQLPGDAAPEVVLVEKNRAGAHWAGMHGYTDGSHALATSPLKDLGFPYRSTTWGSDLNSRVDRTMLQYSWQAFLVDHTSHRTNRFADWVDRGLPEPRLSLWADYLHWVANKISPYPILNGDATSIGIKGDKWEVLVDEKKKSCSGLVITGPGPANMPEIEEIDGERQGLVTDARNFWTNEDSVHQYLREKAKRGSVTIGVIGDGGAAASTILSLLAEFPNCQVKVFAPSGVIFSRGESYDENRHHSYPGDWSLLDSGSRLRFLRHTSNGVFPLHAKRGLNQAENLTTIGGDVEKIIITGRTCRVRSVDPETKEVRVTQRVDCVVVAMGFDDMWWIRLLDNNARQTVLAAILPEEAKSGDFPPTAPAKVCGTHIGRHLELTTMRPYLHLPMLAAYAQGPGFPSLGCLGLLSDRILHTYCGDPATRSLL